MLLLYCFKIVDRLVSSDLAIADSDGTWKYLSTTRDCKSDGTWKYLSTTRDCKSDGTGIRVRYIHLISFLV
jgi:hypothetical protein